MNDPTKFKKDLEDLRDLIRVVLIGFIENTNFYAKNPEANLIVTDIAHYDDEQLCDALNAMGDTALYLSETLFLLSKFAAAPSDNVPTTNYS